MLRYPVSKNSAFLNPNLSKPKRIVINKVFRHQQKFKVPPLANSRGDALTETLISMLALVPVFIIIPYVGKYLDVKDKTIAAARYMTWERSIFSDPGASWGADENSASDDSLVQQVGVRILGDPRQPILTSVDDTAQVITRNPLWVNYKNENLVSLAAFGDVENPDDPDDDAAVLASGMELNEEEAPIFRGPATSALAFGGAGLDGLDLNEAGFASGRVTVPVLPIPDFSGDGAFVDIEAPDNTAARIAMSGQGALLTDSWVPGSEDNFVDRTDGLVTDEILQFLVAPGTFTFGFTLLFNEGRKGQDPDLESDTTVLPPQYVE